MEVTKDDIIDAFSTQIVDKPMADRFWNYFNIKSKGINLSFNTQHWMHFF